MGWAIEGSVVCLTKLYIRLATVAQCLMKGDPHRGTVKKHCADTYETFLMKAMEQVIGSGCATVSTVSVKSSLLFEKGNIMRVMMASYLREKYLALDVTWFRQYINKELGTVHDFYVAKGKEIGHTEKLGRETMKKGLGV